MLKPIAPKAEPRHNYVNINIPASSHSYTNVTIPDKALAQVSDDIMSRDTWLISSNILICIYSSCMESYYFQSLLSKCVYF